MIKRKPKTDEQLFIEWASEDPNWLENMPLNKVNLEAFKKTIDFAGRRLTDRFAVMADAFMDLPEIKGLQKLAGAIGKSKAPTTPRNLPTVEEMQNAFKDQD